MSSVFGRPTLSRDIQELTPTEQLAEILGPHGAQRPVFQQGTPEVTSRTVTTQGPNRGLSFLADFATAFGSGPQAAALQQQRRAEGIEDFFGREQSQANLRSQNVLRGFEDSQMRRGEGLKLKLADIAAQRATDVAGINQAGAAERTKEREDAANQRFKERQTLTKQIADARIEAQRERTKALVASKRTGMDNLPPQVFSKATALASQFDNRPEVKNFSEQVNRAAGVASILQSGVGGPGDLATVFEFMKALDPTSVVRESEYAAAAKSGNIFSGWAAKFNGYLKEEGGFLPDRVKQDFLTILKQKVGISAKQVDALHADYGRRIGQFTGGDGQKYLTNYSEIFNELMGDAGASKPSTQRRRIKIDAQGNIIQ